jgi:hypothetical protein
MSGFWPVFYLLVILKIPVLASLYLVWWASREPDEATEAPEDDGGFRRADPKPRRPCGPRRGPHGAGARPLPECPPGGRTRVGTPPAPVRAGLAHARGSYQGGEGR